MGKSLATQYVSSRHALFLNHEYNTETTKLHKVIVSPMNPRCRLTILFDCCHSGSAVELPFVFRPDAEGRVNLINNVKQGISLARDASNLLHGGFSVEKIRDVQSLIGDARSFFHKVQHPQAPSDESGLADENFMEDWRNEGKDVWMFSGCADDQTSADTSMQGLATGRFFHVLESSITRLLTRHRCNVMGIYPDNEEESRPELCPGTKCPISDNRLGSLISSDRFCKALEACSSHDTHKSLNCRWGLNLI